MPPGLLSRRQIKGLLKPVGFAIRMPIAEALEAKHNHEERQGHKETTLKALFELHALRGIYLTALGLLQ